MRQALSFRFLPKPRPVAVWLGVLVLGQLMGARAKGDFIVHYVNDSSQDAVTVINTGATFTTSFRGTNDISFTRLSGTVGALLLDNYSSTPGNNPAFITNFVGNAAQATGDGVAGHWVLMQTSTSSMSLQIDFAVPLPAGDHFLVADVDNGEQYQVQAYVKNGSNYDPVSLLGWVHQSLTGSTGILPNSNWATWDASTGTLTATAASLNDPIDLFTPDQNIDRIVFTRLSGGTGGAALQFHSTTSIPEPGTIWLSAMAVILLAAFTRLRQCSGRIVPRIHPQLEEPG